MEKRPPEDDRSRETVVSDDGSSLAWSVSGYASHGREPFPAEQSIRWIPHQLEGEGPQPEVLYATVFTQTALRQIGEHVASAEAEISGLLAGELFRCSETGRPWVKVTGAEHDARSLPEDADPKALVEALDAVAGRIQDDGRLVVGWYHSHLLLGVFLSERDKSVHDVRFAEPWQGALVLVDGDRPAGGLFQRTNRGALPRTMYAPFHELLDEESRLPDGGLRSYVPWRNYRADVPDGTEIVGAGAASGAGSRKPERDGRTPPTADERWSAWSEWKRAQQADTENPRLEHPDIPLVLPGDPPEVIVGRRRRLLRRVRNGAAVVVLALAGWLIWTQWPDGSPASEALPPPPEAPGATLSSAAVVAFERALGEFEAAVESYGERQADFDLGRLGCEGLAIGYRAVDESFLVLSGRFASHRDRLPGREAEYEAAAASMENVDQHFDGSGCARPE